MVKGSGKALVCLLVAKEAAGYNRAKTKVTPLQANLNKKAEIFEMYAWYVSLVILCVSIVNLIIKVFTKDNYTVRNIINDIVLYITQFFAVIIVVIPDGLTLVISLSIAFSLKPMRENGLLIKDIESPEIIGTINHILIGKTGTLTTGNLKVNKFWVHGQVKENVRADTLYNSNLKDNVIDLIEDSILYNCDARIEINDDS
jgi:magnesium-transporting ATPase (P-type)